MPTSIAGRFYYKRGSVSGLERIDTETCGLMCTHFVIANWPAVIARSAATWQSRCISLSSLYYLIEIATLRSQ